MAQNLCSILHEYSFLIILDPAIIEVAGFFLVTPF